MAHRVKKSFYIGKHFNSAKKGEQKGKQIKAEKFSPSSPGTNSNNSRFK
jgi:hypothetical protein